MVEILVSWNGIGFFIWIVMQVISFNSDFTGAVGMSKGF